MEKEKDPLKNSLFLKRDKKMLEKVEIINILFVTTYKRDYLKFMTEKGAFFSNQSLNEIEAMLKEFHFLRIHRSYLINLTKIQSIDLEESAVIIGDEKIPLSRANKKLLMERIRVVY